MTIDVSEFLAGVALSAIIWIPLAIAWIIAISRKAWQHREYGEVFGTIEYLGMASAILLFPCLGLFVYPMMK